MNFILLNPVPNDKNFRICIYMAMANIKKFLTLKAFAFILGFFPVLFFIVFLIGEGLAELIDGKLAVIPILLLMVLTSSGYILAWKRVVAGGRIMLTGGAVMGIYMIIYGGIGAWQISLAYSLPFIIPGCLFIISDKK